MGYSSIPNSLAIEFDTYQNSQALDPNANHISIHSHGTAPNSSDQSASLGQAGSLVDLSDGAIHTVIIRYTTGSLRVFLDDLITPMLSVTADLETLLNLDNGTAWLGFTSSTGGDFENHDLLMWSFRPNPPPVRVEHWVVENDGSVEFQFIAAASQTYVVEYSTDLVHWIETQPPVHGTGSIVVWRDSGPPGTEGLPGDQPQRFYRIRVEP